MYCTKVGPNPNLLCGVGDVLHLHINGQGGGDDDDGGGADEFLRVGGTQVGTREANYAPVRHLTRSHPRLLCTKILVSAISGVVMIMMVMVAHHCRQKMMNIARPSKEILVQFT